MTRTSKTRAIERRQDGQRYVLMEGPDGSRRWVGRVKNITGVTGV